MDIHPIFPTMVHSWRSEFDFDKIVSDLEEETFINANINPDNPGRVWQTKHTLHKDERFKEITEFFNVCLEEYKTFYEFECERFDISICWGNYSPAFKQGKHGVHTHPMSYISGVYYLTEGSPTMFEDPVYQRREGLIKLYSVDPNKTPEAWGMIPEPGKLLIFPSWLKHGTLPHTADYARWSISFNAIPVGPCNSQSSESKLACWNVYHAD